MTEQEARELLLRHSHAFHDKYFRPYGMIVLRVDEDTYMMSDENLALTDITAENCKLYDISTGDLGKLLTAQPEIQAMVFVCTETSARFAAAGLTMQPALDDLAQIIGPDVRIARDDKLRSLRTALKGRKGCFLRGKGSVGIGRTLEEAIAAVRILEKSAKAEVFGERIGGIHHLPPADAKALNQYYDQSYSQVNSADHVPFVDVSMDELSLRNALIDCGRELCRRDLVQGTWGNLSVRLDEEQLLISPSGMDYFAIHPEDVVRLDLDKLDYGEQRKPSSEAFLHAAVYRAHPECQAIIHTHSDALSVFAAAHAGFRIPDPALQAGIGDILVSTPALPGTEELAQAVLEAFQSTHACIMPHHGAIFYADSLDAALQLADALETMACSLLGFDAPLAAEAEEADAETSADA